MRRQLDGLLVVRNHVGGERDVVGVEAGGLPGDDGLVGVLVVGVAVGRRAGTRGQEQRGHEGGHDGGDASDARRHDPTVPDTPPGYENGLAG